MIKYDFSGETFCRLLACDAKDTTISNFTEKTFPISHKTSKFGKVFSPQKFPAIRYVGLVQENFWHLLYACPGQCGTVQIRHSLETIFLHFNKGPLASDFHFFFFLTCLITWHRCKVGTGDNCKQMNNQKRQAAESSTTLACFSLESGDWNWY